MKEFLEIGKIVGIHGVRGELKVEPWCDSPEYFGRFGVFYLDGAPRRALGSRVHKGHVLLRLEGIADADAAGALRGKILSVRRADAPLPEGRYFIAELIGLSVLREDTGETLGVLEDVLSGPGGDVYLVRGAREYLIPAVPEFIREIAPATGVIRVHIIEGMASDEN